MERDKFQESLLNHLKGSLFEYKVADYLAKLAQCEPAFLNTLSKDLHIHLAEQARVLTLHYAGFIDLLNLLSLETAKFIKSIYPEIKHVLIVAYDKKIDPDFEGADLLLSIGEQRVGISLKLTTLGAQVNTKSAGIRTFLTEYFRDFKSQVDQEKLNLITDDEYRKLSLDFEEAENLDPTINFSSWKKAHLTELPGQLPSHLKKRYHQYLEKLKTELANVLLSYHKTDEALFKKSLARLVGFPSEQVVQVHALLEDEKQQIFKHKIIRMNDVCHFKDLVFDIGGESSFLTLTWGQDQLIIRLKSMNKFTAPALKVNCSLKMDH